MASEIIAIFLLLALSSFPTDRMPTFSNELIPLRKKSEVITLMGKPLLHLHGFTFNYDAQLCM